MEENIQRLLVNYSNARKSWEAWSFMASMNLKNDKGEIKKYVDGNILLFHLRYLSFKDCFIELSKILKDTKGNSDNIFELLRKKKHSVPELEFTINENISELNKHNSTIQKINDSRDKYFAHLDPDYNDYIHKSIGFHDIEKCFIAIENAIMTLTSRELLMDGLNKIPSKDEFSFK